LALWEWEEKDPKTAQKLLNDSLIIVMMIAMDHIWELALLRCGYREKHVANKRKGKLLLLMIVMSCELKLN